MRALLLPFILIAASLVSAGCVDEDKDRNLDGSDAEALIETSHGDIRIAFFCDAAPLTIDNFRQYALDGFYEGTIFHRIMEDFMIQGGGFTADWNQKPTRGPVPLEYEVPNTRGTVAMARTQDPNSATSQFFINTDDNTNQLGPNPQFGSAGYTVFAEVIEGMDVVDEIAGVAVKPHRHNPDEVSEPVDPPLISRVAVGEPCSSEDDAEPVYGVEAGLIHNTLDGDTWSTQVSAQVDHVPLYVRNTGNRDDTFEVEISAPDGWNVSSEPERYELTRSGGSANTTAGYLTIAYDGDWSSATGGIVTLNLTSESAPETAITMQIRIDVAADPGAVSAPGDTVDIAYTGSFDSGETFDSGSFSTAVAGSQTVPGFSYGLMGLQVGETVDLRFPPELGYGWNQSGSRAQFNGEWLNFEITMNEIS